VARSAVAASSSGGEALEVDAGDGHDLGRELVVDGPAHGVHAGLRGQRRHRARVVAADDLDLDAGLGELVERLLDAGAQLVAEAHEAEGLHLVRQLGRPVAVAEGDRLRPPGEEHDAQAARGPGVGLRPPVGAGAQRRCHHLGRAEDVRAGRLAVGEREPAPLARRREERLVRGLEARGRQGLAQRLDGAVGVGGAGREGAEQLGQAALLGAQRQRLLQLDHARRERAGLVGAQHVDVAQRFDGVELLHQHVLAEQPHGAERVGEGDGEHEAVGDERQDDGRHAHALHERHAADRVAHPHEDLEDDDHEEQHAHDLVDLALQGRELAFELGGLGRELVGEALEADLLGLVVAAARHAEAAREQRIAGMLGHEVRFAGEQRLVHFHAALADHRAIDDHLVAGVQVEDVAEHHLGRVEVLHPALPHHARLGPHEDGDAVHHALGADLLDEADDRVGEDDEDDDEGVEGLAEGKQHDAQHVEQVVDEVEDVVAHDAPVGAPRADLDVVALAGGAAPAGLLLAEAGERGRRVGALGVAHVRTVSEGTGPRGPDAGGESPVVGATPHDVDGGAPSSHGAHGGRHGCC